MSSTRISTPQIEPSPVLIPLGAAVCVGFFVLGYYRILLRVCCLINRTTQVPQQRLYEANADLSIQFERRGLENSFIQSLPVTKFKEKIEAEEVKRDTECSVCLSEYEEGELLRHLPSCNHSFHICCIDMWLQSHTNCPLCRSIVYRLGTNPDYSVSMSSLLETLTREDFVQERGQQYQNLRIQILRSAFGHDR